MEGLSACLQSDFMDGTFKGSNQIVWSYLRMMNAL